jgi:CBS domain-containing protein
MTTELVTLRPEMTLNEAAQVLLHLRIHGAPVVDAAGVLVGSLSLTDAVGMSGVTVADVMNRHPVTATEDTPAREVAGIMLEKMVQRVVIVRAQAPVGLVSASDIVKLFLTLYEQPASSAR